MKWFNERWRFSPVNREFPLKGFLGRRAWMKGGRLTASWVALVQFLLIPEGRPEVITQKLSPPPTIIVGSTGFFEFSPDSSRVVYHADPERDGCFHLYSVPPTGGESTRLTDQSQGRGRWYKTFRFTLNDRSVIYRSVHGGALYRVPLDGGEVTRITGITSITRFTNPRDFRGPILHDYQIGPNERYIVFRADGNFYSTDFFGQELYSVSLTGGEITKLNGRLAGRIAGPHFVTDGNVHDFKISPDGSRVVYRADQDTDEVNELYSVPIMGGDYVKLNAPLEEGDGVLSDYQISPDGSRVVYRTESGGQELFSAPLNGGEVSKISGGEVVLEFSLTPDGSRVLYRGIQDGGDVEELYSVPISGGEMIKLNHALAADEDVKEFLISSDGFRAVFRIFKESDEIGELFGVPPSGGEVTGLNAAQGAGTNAFEDFQISSDNLHLVYRANQGNGGPIDLYRMPLTGGDVTQLSSPSVEDSSVEHFKISHDGSRVFFVGHQEPDGRIALYTVPSTGGDVTNLTGPVTDRADILAGFKISPDDRRVAYHVDRDARGASELFSAGLAEAPVKLSQPLLYDGDVQQIAISPDGAWVVYMANQTLLYKVDLYSVPITGGPVTRIIDPSSRPSADVATFSISPDSSRIVYLSDGESVSRNELFSVPIAGGDVVKLNEPIPHASGLSWDFRISPDSHRVLFLHDPENNQLTELFSVPLSGGEVIRLHGPDIDTLGYEGPFKFSAGSSNHVVYVAHQPPDGNRSLYSAPVSGGEAVKLSGELELDYIPFRITPDHNRVVFIGREDSEMGESLYSVLLNGESLTKLTTPHVEGVRIVDILIATDLSRVVYTEDIPVVSIDDKGISHIRELYSVPLNGGEITKLNAPLVDGGDAVGPNADFEISPDSEWVVYMADQDTDDVVELYVVPITGGEAATLNLPLVDGGDVSNFEISPDSSRVIYRAYQDTLAVQDLYSVPIEGGEVTKLNEGLVEGGDVAYTFVITPDSGRVIYYRADQTLDDVYYVYSVPLAGGRPTRRGGPVPPVRWASQSGGVSPDGNRVIYRSDTENPGMIELYSSYAVFDSAVAADWLEFR